AWLPYFAVGGTPAWLGWHLMPLIGTVDIAVGVMTLARPRRLFLLYAALWALWTALLRPLAGQGGWEFVERAGNYGVPLALLSLSGAGGTVADRLRHRGSPRFWSWLAEPVRTLLTAASAAGAERVLRLTPAPV